MNKLQKKKKPGVCPFFSLTPTLQIVVYLISQKLLCDDGKTGIVD